MKNIFITSNIKALGLIALLAISFVSCKQNDEIIVKDSASKPSLNFVGLTNTSITSTAGQLIRYTSGNINQIVGAAVSITGVQTGETILAIDYRPATGTLYGVGSTSRLYVINPLTGVARQIGAGPFTPAISGGIAGFDFNPTVDRIRLVTKSGQNLRLNPEDGTVVATDGNISGGTNVVLGEVAYTNSTQGAASTELYDVDFNSGNLYKQDANVGALTLVGSLNVQTIPVALATYSSAYAANITNNRPGGFDIASTGEALAVFNNGSVPAIPVGGVSAGPPASPSSAASAVVGTPTLFQIDLTTCKARDLGLIPFPAPSNGVAATALVGLAIAPAPVAYAIDETNGLVVFNLTNTPLQTITKPITGLQAGENVLGLDFRPVNGQLYALGSTSRIYTINASSGAATAVSAVPFVPLLSGNIFGVDFNPSADALRVISNTGQNLRINITTGTATVDGTISGGSKEITGAAYTNNLIPSSATTLFTISTKTDSLYRFANPNDGIMTKVGKLNINVGATDIMGFDITTSANNTNNSGNTAYAILTKGTVTKIYSINLSLGSAVEVGTFPKKVRAFTVGLGF